MDIFPSKKQELLLILWVLHIQRIVISSFYVARCWKTKKESLKMSPAEQASVGFSQSDPKGLILN